MTSSGLMLIFRILFYRIYCAPEQVSVQFFTLSLGNVDVERTGFSSGLRTAGEGTVSPLTSSVQMRDTSLHLTDVLFMLAFKLAIKWLTIQLLKFSPPEWASSAVDLTLKIPFSIVSIDLSKVPLPNKNQHISLCPNLLI